MATPQLVKIDDNQASKWATEVTLNKLLKESNATRGVIEKYLSTIAGWDEKQLNEARNFANATQKGFKSSIFSNNQGFDLVNRGLKGVSVNLSGSFGQVIKGLGVLSSPSGLGNLSTASNAAAAALSKTSGVLPGFTKYISLAGVEILGLVGGVVAIAYMVEDLNENFSKLYDSGINLSGGLDGLVNVSKSLELSTSETAKVLSQFGSTVTILGVDRTEKLIKEFKNLSNKGAAFGLNLEEAAESVLNYAAIVRTTGDLSSMSIDQLAKNAKKYNEELSLTSQITGESRKELERNLKQQRESTKGIADLSALPKELRNNMAILGPQFMSLGEAGKDLQENLIKYLGPLGTAAINRADLIAMQQIGVWQEFEKMGANIKGGSINIRDNIDAYADVIAKMSEEEKGRINYMAEHGNQFAQSIQKMIASTINLKESKEKELEQAKELYKQNKWLGSLENARNIVRSENQKKTDAENKLAREAQSTLTSAGTQLSLVFQKLVVNVLKPMLPIFNALGDGVIFLTDKFHDAIGDVSTIFDNLASKFKLGLDTKDFTEFKKTVNELLTKIFNWENFESIKKFISDMLPADVKVYLKEAYNDMKIVVGGIVSTFKWFKEHMDGITTAVEVIGSALLGSWLFKKAFDLKNMIVGPKTPTGPGPVGPTGTTIGKAADLLGKGAGAAAGGILSGIASGIEILGSALSTLGPMAPAILEGSLAVGGAISTIGASLALTTFLMGKGLPSLANGFKSFTEIDGNKLSEVGNGLIQLSKGIAAISAGGILGSISGLIEKFAGLFGADPMSKLEKFAEFSKYTPSINAISDSFKSLAESWKSLTESLKIPMPAMDIEGINSILKLTDKINGLNLISETLNKFASEYKNLSESLRDSSESILNSIDKLKNLSIPNKLSLPNIIDQFDNEPRINFENLLPDMNINQTVSSSRIPAVESIDLINAIKDSQSITNQSKVETSTTESATNSITSGQADLTRKTVQHYDEFKSNNRTTQEMLMQIKMSLDNLNNSINNQTSTLSRSIVKASPVIT